MPLNLSPSEHAAIKTGVETFMQALGRCVVTVEAAPWAPKFKIGDRVCYVALPETGVVNAVDSESRAYYIHFDKGSKYSVTEDWLEAAPDPEREALVPLEAKDVPPLSVIRHKSAHPFNWFAVDSVHLLNIKLGGYEGNLGTQTPNYKELMECEILRPGQTEWQPCSKPSRS